MAKAKNLSPEERHLRARLAVQARIVKRPGVTEAQRVEHARLKHAYAVAKAARLRREADTLETRSAADLGGL